MSLGLLNLPARQLVLIRYVGSITQKEAEAFIALQYGIAEIRASLCRLVDMREASLDISPENWANIPRLLMRHARPEERRVLLVDTPRETAMASLLTDSVRLHTQGMAFVCASPERACLHLSCGLSPDVLQSRLRTMPLFPTTAALQDALRQGAQAFSDPTG